MSPRPEHPGNPSDPWGGNSDPDGNPPPDYGPHHQWQRGYTPPPSPQPEYPPPPEPRPDYDPHHQWQRGYTPPPEPQPDYPPPPPGYGEPQPPAADAAPSPDHSPPADQQFNVADAFSWAWKKFSKNVTAMVVPTLVYLAVTGVIGAILLGRLSSHAAGFGGLHLSGIGVFYLVIIPACVFMQAAFLSGCLDIADGKSVTVGSFFHAHNFGRVALSALLVIVLTTMGNILCGFLGLIFSFFALFTIAFTTDRALPPVEALNASIAMVKSNTRDALLSWLVQVLVLAVGALLCGVGMLVAFPVATLIQTYTCRRLSEGTIAPVSD
jgi:uncharacterized membrane protein